VQPFRIGFIGGGTIARWHAQRVTDLGHTVSAVADIAPDVRKSFAEEYGADEQFEEYERMLAEANLDVVVVAVPNSLHADCAVAALESDTNVFVEKPMAATVEGAERIAEAESDSDSEVLVGFMKSFEATVDTIDNAVTAGEFGDIYEVNVEYVRRRGIPQIGSWFTRKDLAGGGAVVDIGPHMLHLALQVLDFPEIESVSATAGAHFGSKDDYTYLNMWGGDPTGDRTFDVEDHARAIIRTVDGTTIHINIAWASNREGVQHIQILGDEAGATIDPGKDSFEVHSTKHGSLSDDTRQPPSVDVYEAEWSYFFDVLADEREHTRNTVGEGLTIQRVIDAIYRSADAGEEVEI
jgi:predicted dehydrogenase